ncbi:MAG: hypothetical protein NTY50_01080 [Methylobacter sp.]|nr:hypothetical protein [Methylobacter sp.]
MTTTPSIPTTLVPAIEVLGNTLAQTAESYQRLLAQPEHYSLCHEAGRSLRYLSERYSQVLLAAFRYQAEPDEAENWEGENDMLSEEELDG